MVMVCLLYMQSHNRTFTKKGGKPRKPRKSSTPFKASKKAPSTDETQNGDTDREGDETITETTPLEKKKSTTKLTAAQLESERTSDDEVQESTTVAHPKKHATRRTRTTLSTSQKGSQARVSEVGPTANQGVDPHARVSETPEHVASRVPSSPRSVLKDFSVVLTKQPNPQPQWFVPENIHRKRKSSVVRVRPQNDDQEVHNGEQAQPKQRGRSLHKSVSVPPKPVAASSEREVEGKGRTKTAQRQKQEGMNETSKPKRGRGRPRKSASMQPATSSESELEDWMETIRLNQRKDDTQGKKTEVTRGRGRPRKSAPAQSASSESEVEGVIEDVQENYNMQSKKSELKRGRGRPRTRKSASAQPAVSSESDLEGMIEEMQDRRSEPKQGKGRPLESVATLPATTSESEVEENLKTTQQQKNIELQRRKPELKRGRGHPHKPAPPPSTSAASEREAEEPTRSKKKSEPKRARGRPHKSAPPSATASESEVEDSLKTIRQKSQGKKTEPKRGRGRPRKPAAPPASATSESEMEERDTKITRQMNSSTSPITGVPTISESEDEVSQQPRRKRSRLQHLVNASNLNNALEDENPGEMDGPQFGFSDDNLGDVSPPPSPPATHEADSDVGSTSATVLGRPTASPGSAGRKGGRKATDLSGAESIDVSVLPRLNKRKRARTNKIVLAPHPKKQKQNPTAQAEQVKSKPSSSGVPSTTREVDPHIYSMSSSEEDDQFRGEEITQSGGGRRYRRLRVGPSKSHTPGVRRSNRTKIAPVRHWENEQPEYDTRRRSGESVNFHIVLYYYGCVMLTCCHGNTGVRLKGILVPLEQEEEHQQVKKKAKSAGVNPGAVPGSQEDGEFSPLRVTDVMGNTRELRKIEYTAM